MSKVLLTSVADIKSYSSVSGNIDANKILPTIYKTQRQYIEYLLGTDLMAKLQALILADTLDDVGNENYKYLLQEKVVPCHVNYTVAHLIVDLMYEISNGGVNQHSPENATPVTKDEGMFLKQQYMSDGDLAKTRLVDYLCTNSSLFPEYSSNTEDDIRPSSDKSQNLGLFMGRLNYNNIDNNEYLYYRR